MALNKRQAHLFTEKANLYRPSHPAVFADQGAKDLVYSWPPDYEDVPYYKAVTVDTNQAGPVGRTNYDIMLTTDKFHMDIDQEIGDGWLLQVTKEDSEDFGQFYVVQGVGRVQDRAHRRPNLTQVFATKSPKPILIGEPT